MLCLSCGVNKAVSGPDIGETGTDVVCISIIEIEALQKRRRVPDLQDHRVVYLLSFADCHEKRQWHIAHFLSWSRSNMFFPPLLIAPMFVHIFHIG